MEQKSINKKKIILITTISIPCAILLAFFIFVGIRTNSFNKTTEAKPLSNQEALYISQLNQKNYASRYQLLQNLPYNLTNPNLDIFAESAILIDVSSGSIIYEKNADEIIPPASMTKLFTMYIVDQEVSSGRLHYDDIIPLPPESWACNMPPHSSLMFLGEGQIVTLEEILLGLSIASGNDAAYALAYVVSGGMEQFIQRMNQTAMDLGLTNTHFVESSGYSELNTTTAREMATFCRVYLKEHPDSLERFHAVRQFTYPKSKNMAPGDTYGPQDFSKGFPQHITMGITQKNTNPLLDVLDGCDGLKTGYIDESGYNLALTAQRNGTRFLSVTMKGPGNNTREGQQGRIHDGTELMEFGFGSFSTYRDFSFIKPHFIKTYGAKEKAINLIPAFNPEALCVPFVTGSSLMENLSKIQIVEEFPDYLSDKITAGTEYGRIKIILDEYLLDTIPFVADRDIEVSNKIVQFADKLLKK